MGRNGAQGYLHLNDVTTLNVDAFYLAGHPSNTQFAGSEARGNIDLAAATTPTSVNIRDKAGTGGADLYMAWQHNTGAMMIYSTVDLRGATVDVLFDTVAMGHNRPNNWGGGYANVYFDAGTVSMSVATLGWNNSGNTGGAGDGRIYVSGTGALAIGTLRLGDNDGGTGGGYGIVYLRSDDASFRATTIQDAGTHASNESKMIRRIQIEGGTFGNIDGTDLTLASGIAILLAGTGTRTIDITEGRTGTINGAIGEDAAGKGLTKTGDGTLILNAASTYTGVTTIAGGEIHVLESVLDVAAAQAAIANGSFAPRSLVVTDIGTHTRIALPPAGTLITVR